MEKCLFIVKTRDTEEKVSIFAVHRPPDSLRTSFLVWMRGNGWTWINSEEFEPIE